MDEATEKVSPNPEDAKVPESPKPLAFTIDFGEGKTVDSQRYKNLVEKYQNRHRRGQSLSKFEDSSSPSVKKHPLTGNLPRKSSFHSEGYFSSDEKVDKFKYQGARSTVLNTVISKGDLTLPLRNVASDRMTQSFPSRNFDLPSINSPEIELKDVSSPELDLISPISPLNVGGNDVQSNKLKLNSTSLVSQACRLQKLAKQHSSPECESRMFTESQPTDSLAGETFVSGTDFDFEKSDTVSDAGTYTLDADNYTEEQKARMSIDREFNIEQVSVVKKTQEYIQSLHLRTDESVNHTVVRDTSPSEVQPVKHKSSDIVHHTLAKEQIAQQVTLSQSTVQTATLQYAQKVRNISECETTGKITKKIFNKILYPSAKAQSTEEPDQSADQGVFTSITASGVLSKRPEKQGHVRRSSLVQSEIFVEAYTGDTIIKQPYDNVKVIHTKSAIPRSETSQNGAPHARDTSSTVVPTQKRNSLILDDNSKVDVEPEPQVIHAGITVGRITTLPPAVGGISGKNSPTKIPSPVHALRPRSRNSLSSQNLDLSDSSLETESYLKPTQNIISSLQARLSIDSDQDSDYDKNYNVTLNNETKNLLKNKPMHVRHNSFDDRNVKVQNKLEHFHSKNLQGIDQTLKSCNQYTQNKPVHRIQNSPNNSPIRRSSSFSLKNKFDTQPKCLNTAQTNKESNVAYNSPNFQRNGSVQRSASTASIKPTIEQLRRSSVSSDYKTNKPQYVDTESSSDEDFDKTLMKHKKDLTTTRYNRAFSLRRARLDTEPPVPKCPNTPEMRRKFVPNEKSERTVSVDRKSGKTPEVQSRYMNISKTTKPVQPKPVELPKSIPKPTVKPPPNKPAIFSRTDTGRFSMRTPKPASAPPKLMRRDQGNVVNN